MVCHGSVCARVFAVVVLASARKLHRTNCSHSMCMCNFCRCESNKFIIFASSPHRVVSCDKMLCACVCAFSFIWLSFMYNMCGVPLHMIAKYTSIQFRLKLFQSSLPHFFSLFARRTTISVCVCVCARAYSTSIFSHYHSLRSGFAWHLLATSSLFCVFDSD